jgi:dihydrofolate reductase
VKLALILAVADNGVIGRDNALPWKLPEDMRYFKQMTMGKPVIMGRKTFESIGKALPGRTNIVITRNGAFAAEGARCVSSLEEALQVAEQAVSMEPAEEAVVIGGSEIYRVTLPLADRLYITEVHANVEGDAVLPRVEWDDWREVRRERHVAQTPNPYDYSFVFYERARA